MSPDFDAIVVGAGFAGIRMLYLLRENGFNVRGIERYKSIGGVWNANGYPGARCDSPQPFYQIHDETLASGWTFSKMFPDHSEMCRPNVDVVDMGKEVTKITRKGIHSGSIKREFDVIICATGFEPLSAGITRLNITGKHGVHLADVWKTRIISYLGMTVPAFPNMFYLVGPQGPTVKVNVPTTVECQTQWILSLLKSLRESHIDCCEPTLSAAQGWVEKLNQQWNDSLYANANVWEARSSSDKSEPLWIQGVQKYNDYIQQCRAPDFRGFSELRLKPAMSL